MGWFTDIISLQPLGTSAAAQATSDAADAKLLAIDQSQLDAGTISQAQYDQMNANIGAGALDVNSEIDGAFVQGAQDGLHAELALPGKVVGAVGDASGSLLGGILKNIPWWAWIGAAGALFVWMGGLSLLRGRLKK